MKLSTMFEDMAKSPAAWLSSDGKESLVVLSTRVRLARNIAGCKFPESADSDTKKKIIGYFDSVLTRSKLLSDGHYSRAVDIDDIDKDFLVERHLISPVFLNGDIDKSLFISKDERVSIMVNEEDHLRIQALSPGLNVMDSFDMASAYEAEIGNHLEFSYDDDFGYLT